MFSAGVHSYRPVKRATLTALSKTRSKVNGTKSNSTTMKETSFKSVPGAIVASEMIPISMYKTPDIVAEELPEDIMN